MKLIIAGPRDLNIANELVNEALYHYSLQPNLIICGGATGVDYSAERYARRMNIPSLVFRAKWEELGKSAGPRRNAEMVDMADALFVIKVKGVDTKETSDMIRKAEDRDIPVYIYEVG